MCVCRCTREYAGPTCNEFIGGEESSNNVLVIVLPIVGAILALILALVIYFMCKERSRRTSASRRQGQYRESVPPHCATN